MFKRITWSGLLLSFGLLTGTPTAAIAQMPHSPKHPTATEQTNQLQQVDQPLWLKAAVTASGLGLIGLEFWWFLLNKPGANSQKAACRKTR